MIQWTRSALRNGERQRQQAIRGETEQKSGEKEKGRSRDDACGSGVVHLLPSRVHTHAAPADAEATRRDSLRNDN